MFEGSNSAGVRRRAGSRERYVNDDSGEKDKSGVQRVVLLQGYALAALGVLALVAVLTPPDFFMSSRSNDMLGDSIAEESDEAVWNQTVREIAQFRKTGELPTFGLTEGRYYYMNSEMKSNAALRLKQLCKYDCTNNTKPPLELLRPGRLADGLQGSRSGAALSERALCFLWYAAQIWTRPMGGRKGLLLARIGAGVDDKAFLIHALEAYQSEHGCQAWSVAPPTIELNDTAMCRAFFRNNKAWAPRPDTLWFIKAADGSTGSDVERTSDSGQASCPIPGGIASLEVPEVLLMQGRKFDNRVFVLVASFDPLVILFHPGHIRRSIFNYSEPFTAAELALNASMYHDRQFEDRLRHATSKMTNPPAPQGPPAAGGRRPPPVSYAGGQKPEESRDLARHVTNPRFGLAHTNDSSAVLQPLSSLKEYLISSTAPDPERGSELWKTLEASVRNAALHITYAIQQKFFGRHYHSRWGFMWLAMDVVYDSKMNAMVVDINSGPSFYHEHKWPAWFVRERSAITREAIDCLQEVGFLKATKHTSKTPLTPPKHWEVLYHEHRGGIQQKGLVAPGECAKKREA